jgi:hypothetical protein
VAGEQAPAAGGTFDAAADPLARTVFAVLVLACFAAFFLTQRLKHTPTPVQAFERSPTFRPGSPDARDRQERLSFKLAQAQAVTVSIIDSNGNTVATLVQNRPAPRYKQFSLRWNGRQGTAHAYDILRSASGHHTLVPLNHGPKAPPGEYRARVQLLGQHKEVLSPWSFKLVGG